jgi:hypothetical protein
MKEKIETTILRNLLCNEEYYRKVVPFLKPEYFQDYTERVLYEEIQDFSTKYDKLPTKEVLILSLQERNDLTEDVYKEGAKKIQEFTEEWIDKDWLVNSTEKWCKDRAIYNALLQSIKIADGEGDKKISRDAIPSILQEALAVSFDEYIGHDYVDNVEQRYEYYHKEESKIPFDLEKFNLITKGGLPNKTLNVALAGTGVGKSLFMCHCAASCISQGKNVLYITLEMAEEKIAERIDANLLNVNIKDINSIPETIFTSRVKEIGRKTQGKLIIKEYPTAAAIPIVSATQTTRGGFGNSDVDLTDTSESFGLPATADFMFALIATEELEQSGRIMVKQLKNRYNDPTFHKRFTVGIDRAKMKLYNVEDSEGAELVTEAPEETFEVLEEVSERQKRLNKFSQFII